MGNNSEVEKETGEKKPTSEILKVLIRDKKLLEQGVVDLPHFSETLHRAISDLTDIQRGPISELTGLYLQKVVLENIKAARLKFKEIDPQDSLDDPATSYWRNADIYKQAVSNAVLLGLDKESDNGVIAQFVRATFKEIDQTPKNPHIKIEGSPSIETQNPTFVPFTKEEAFKDIPEKAFFPPQNPLDLIKSMTPSKIVEIFDLEGNVFFTEEDLQKRLDNNRELLEKFGGELKDKKVIGISDLSETGVSFYTQEGEILVFKPESKFTKWEDSFGKRSFDVPSIKTEVVEGVGVSYLRHVALSIDDPDVVKEFNERVFNEGFYTGVLLPQNIGKDKSNNIWLRDWDYSPPIERFDEFKKVGITLDDYEVFLHNMVPDLPGLEDYDHINGILNQVGEDKFKVFYGEQYYQSFKEVGVEHQAQVEKRRQEIDPFAPFVPFSKEEVMSKIPPDQLRPPMNILDLLDSYSIEDINKMQGEFGINFSDNDVANFRVWIEGLTQTENSILRDLQAVSLKYFSNGRCEFISAEGNIIYIKKSLWLQYYPPNPEHGKREFDVPILSYQLSNEGYREVEVVPYNEDVSEWDTLTLEAWNKFQEEIFLKGYFYASSAFMDPQGISVDKAGHRKIRNWNVVEKIDDEILEKIKASKLSLLDYSTIHHNSFNPEYPDDYDIRNSSHILEILGEEKFRKYYGEEVWNNYQKALEKQKENDSSSDTPPPDPSGPLI